MTAAGAFPATRTGRHASNVRTPIWTARIACNTGPGAVWIHWQQAHAWCVESKRKKLGRPIEGEYTCLTIEDPAGKPRRDCFGPGINECEESYAQDLPDVTIENTSKINIGQNWWGVGGDERSTVTWGGSRGFIEGCRLASDEAADICFENRDVCYEEAGGCQ